MDSPFTDVIKQGAGMAVGGLSALASIRGGGLLNYMMNRERMMNDPSFRAGLQGSPFAAGVLGITGSRQPVAQPGQGMPAAGSVATPEEMQPGFVGPPAPAQQVAPPGSPAYTPGYVPGQPREWQPNLPPYSPEQQVSEQARVSMLQGIQSQDTAQRAANKVAAGIIPLPAETDELVRRGIDLRQKAGIGSTVSVPIPGMKLDIGSPYTAVGPGEYQSYGEAAAAANAQGGGAHPVPTGRGSWQVAPGVAAATPPTPAAPGAPTTGPAAPPAPSAPGAAGGQRPPGAIAAQPAVRPPAPTQPPPPPPPPRPAPAPRAAVQTCTPGLSAGQVQLPTAPAPPPPYAGPYDPNAVASTPRQPPPAYPSPAPPPEEDLSAPVAGPGFLSRVGSFFTPTAAVAAEPPRVAPVVVVAGPAPSGAVGFSDWGFRPPPTTPTTQPPPAPPPDTRVPPWQPGRQVTVVAPPQPVQPPPAGAPAAAVAPGMPAGTAAPPLARRTYRGTEGQEDIYEFGPLSDLAADAKSAGITDFRGASDTQIARFNQLRLARQQQEQVSQADIARTMRAPTQAEAVQIQLLTRARDDLNNFYREYPSAEKRDIYVGYARRPVLDALEYIRADPKFTGFFDDLANFRKFSDDAKELLDPATAANVRGTVPTGYERSPAQFEKRLADFNYELSRNMALMSATLAVPVGDITPQWFNLMNSYFDRVRGDQEATRDAARGGEQPPSVTIQPPAWAQPQPQPQAPVGFNVLQDRPAQ
jgi:hypothetical protein